MDTDVLIIGGGVVGLACAAESSRRRFRTILVERHSSFGQETSSRNSEVIHSGIYYPTGSLKATLCVRANGKLYGECARRGVWQKKCGKLIVAVTPEEEPELEKLYRKGVANGVEGMEILNATDVRKLEPYIGCLRAIFLPTTGIIDSHELMRSLLTEARSDGADTAFGIEFLAAERKPSGYSLRFRDADGTTVDMEARIVINAAGLASDRVAQAFGIDIDAAGYRLHHNRGHYYTVSASKSRLVTHLVYPMPHPQLVGAGIHITLDRAGQCKLGPDTEYLEPTVPESEWYKFDEGRKEKFFTAVVRYFPSLEREDLSPGQVGVRPKLMGSSESLKDFIINEESSRGLPGLVDLVGIESPGLTCAMEIAKEALDKVRDA